MLPNDVPPLHLLETFIIYSGCENLVKTAKLTGQTQPSASRQIQQFEKYFKKKIFLSIGRQKKLTPYGESIRKYYKDQILKLRELRESFSTSSLLNQPEFLSVYARSEILERYIAPLKFKFSVELRAATGDFIRESMKNGQLDVAVLQENFESYNYTRKRLFSSVWVLIVPQSWKISTKNPKEIMTALCEKPFASYDANLATLKACSQKGFDFSNIKIDFIAQDWRLIAQRVQFQQCWSIVPVGFDKLPEVQSISLQTFMKDSVFYLYFRKDLTKNPNVHHFIEQLS